MEATRPGGLIPLGLPERTWVEFRAHGFPDPVCGVIYRLGEPAVSGVPLGGIGTGCLDLDTSGTIGFSTAFSYAPGHDWTSRLAPNRTRGKLDWPFLGLVINGEVWVLAGVEMGGVKTPDEIHYWGHYPVADLEYECLLPVRVALRAWAPFIPGDAEASNTPGAVFELHLHNASDTAQSPSIVCTFPGACQEGERAESYTRCSIESDIRGVWVSDEQHREHFLGAIGQERVQLGGSIAAQGSAWARVATNLPAATDDDPGSSLRLDLHLEPGETRVVHILLAWYAPTWESYAPVSGAALGPTETDAGWSWTRSGQSYKRKYAQAYGNALEVAQFLARQHQPLLARVLAWQQAVYSDLSLPPWLRDALVNVLHLLSEDGLWAAADPSLGSWVRPEEGLFGFCESLVADGQIECIPCSWYGNLPIVFFFPELALSTLRGYRAYSTSEGDVPFSFGQGFDMASPAHYRQRSLNGPCYADLVDRLWQRTGDDQILDEFYPGVKASVEYTMSLRPGRNGVISLADGNVGGDEWYESMRFYGMVPHVAGLRLAQLRIAERMAERVGDQAFAVQCREWLKQGSHSLEGEMWCGTHYLLYKEPQSGRQSDHLLAFQMDGEWVTDLHGLPGVFNPNRVLRTLETISRRLDSLSESGLVTLCQADGSLVDINQVHERQGGLACWPASVFILAAIYVYKGLARVGLNMARRTMHTVVCKMGLGWDFPNIIDVSPCSERLIYGCDYYQAMSLWALPAAIEGKSLESAVSSESLVSRVLLARHGCAN